MRHLQPSPESLPHWHTIPDSEDFQVHVMDDEGLRVGFRSLRFILEQAGCTTSGSSATKPAPKSGFFCPQFSASPMDHAHLWPRQKNGGRKFFVNIGLLFEGCESTAIKTASADKGVHLVHSQGEGFCLRKNLFSLVSIRVWKKLGFTAGGACDKTGRDPRMRPERPIWRENPRPVRSVAE
jgi:hypothetical protein